MKNEKRKTKKATPSASPAAKPAVQPESPAAENTNYPPLSPEALAWRKNLEESNERIQRWLGNTPRMELPGDKEKGIKVYASGTGFNTAGKTKVDPELQKMANELGLTVEDMALFRSMMSTRRR